MWILVFSSDSGNTVLIILIPTYFDTLFPTNPREAKDCEACGVLTDGLRIGGRP